MEREHENLAVPAFEKEFGRRVCPALIVDVHRRCGLGVSIDDDERHTTLAEWRHVGVALVEADDHEPVDRRRGDRALKRTTDGSHREKADAALVGHAADPLEERREERVGEHRRDRLREEDAEDPDAL